MAWGVAVDDQIALFPVPTIATLSALGTKIFPFSLQVGEHIGKLSATKRQKRAKVPPGWLQRYGPAVLSAIAVPLALPNELAPMGNPLLGPFAFAPLFLSIYRSESYPQAAAVTVLFMVVTTPLSYYWLLHFQEFAIWTLGGPVLGYALFGALLGPVLRGVALAAGCLRPYAVAAAWTVYEFLKSSGFLGYPWGLAAYPMNTITPLIQFTTLTGVWGLSLLMALVNAVVAEGVQRPWRLQPTNAYCMTAVLMIVALGYGFVRLGTENLWGSGESSSTPFKVALIQHNRDPWSDNDDSSSARELMRLTRHILEETNPDLIVWSETALRFPPTGKYSSVWEIRPKGDPLARFLRNLDIHLITGSAHFYGVETVKGSNAAFLISPYANHFDYYHKQNLVPFAELVPFWQVGFMRRFYRSTVGIGPGWIAGEDPTVFTVKTSDDRSVRLSTPICFEDAFPTLNRQFVRSGAELLINLTNDSWSRTLSAESQHLVAARFRSVETARPLLRATNGGITVALDIYGKPIPGSMLVPFTASTALVTLYLPESPTITPYTQFGDYLPVSLIIAVFLLIAKDAASNGRRRKSPSKALQTSTKVWRR